MSNSHKTAIRRTKLSAPMKWLHENGCLPKERILDYGCGRGADADNLHRMGYRIFKYDPHFFPDLPFLRYNTITCLYVLNTIRKAADRYDVIRHVMSRLGHKGTAYFSIRADKKSLNGKTSKDTWQGYTPKELVDTGGKLLHRTSGFELYCFNY